MRFLVFSRCFRPLERETSMISNLFTRAVLLRWLHYDADLANDFFRILCAPHFHFKESC